jgi:hypothetical protein
MKPRFPRPTAWGFYVLALAIVVGATAGHASGHGWLSPAVSFVTTTLGVRFFPFWRLR